MMKKQVPSKAAVDCRLAIINAMKPFKDKLSAAEILAVMGYTVGQVIALQDQRTMTNAMIWELLGANIEAGNADVIKELFDKREGSA